MVEEDSLVLYLHPLPRQQVLEVCSSSLISRLLLLQHYATQLHFARLCFPCSYPIPSRLQWRWVCSPPTGPVPGIPRLTLGDAMTENKGGDEGVPSMPNNMPLPLPISAMGRHGQSLRAFLAVNDIRHVQVIDRITCGLGGLLGFLPPAQFAPRGGYGPHIRPYRSLTFDPTLTKICNLSRKKGHFFRFTFDPTPL